MASTQQIELHLDSWGRHVATIFRTRKYEAGDVVRVDREEYYIVDVCYDGRLGSAEVELVRH